MSNPSDREMKMAAACFYWVSMFGTIVNVDLLTHNLFWDGLVLTISMQIFSLVQLGRNRQ